MELSEAKEDVIKNGCPSGLDLHPEFVAPTPKARVSDTRSLCSGKVILMGYRQVVRCVTKSNLGYIKDTEAINVLNTYFVTTVLLQHNWTTHFRFALLFHGGSGSSVGIATELRAGRSGDWIPVRERFSAPVQTGSGAHPAPCTMGTGSFPRVKSGRGVTLTPHPLLVPWSWKGRAIPLLPLWAVRPLQRLSACTRVHFTFFFVMTYPTEMHLFFRSHRWEKLEFHV